MIRIDILSLFPGYFTSPLQESMIGRAREGGIVDLRIVDIRDFAEGRHRTVDDRAYGGGPGMVLMAEPVARAIRAAKSADKRSRVIYLTPQGKTLTAVRCRELAAYDQLILLCGHYEGVDQRVLDREVEEEISIGDYVLTNGCLPAIVLVDAVVRFVPGVIGHADAAKEDSFEADLLDCPHYTRPEVWEERVVPRVLLGGDHTAIDRWRTTEALAKTAAVRPDLLVAYTFRRQQAGEAPAKEKAPRVCREGPPSQIAMRVRNLRESRRFYRDQLGLRLVAEEAGSVVFALGDHQQLMLTEGDGERVPPQFEATESDPQRLLQLARSATGYEAASGTDPDAPKVIKVWFRDPDGYQWIISQQKNEY